MGRPRINKGKNFKALVINKPDIVYSDENSLPTITAFWMEGKANHLSTFLNRMKRSHLRVVIAFEVGSEKHKDILDLKHRTFTK